MIENAETQVPGPRTDKLVLERWKTYDNYPTSTTTSSYTTSSSYLPYSPYPSYCQSPGAGPGFPPTSFATVVISETTTITLTTTELLTSQSILATAAPLVGSNSENMTLSPHKIVGIVGGALGGLLIFLLIFYLVLTRTTLMPQLDNNRLEEKETEYRRKRPRRSSQATKPAEHGSRTGKGNIQGRQTRRNKTTRTQARPFEPEQTLKELEEGSKRADEMAQKFHELEETKAERRFMMKSSAASGEFASTTSWLRALSGTES
ncbi:hypothetical protein F4808DRAFT_459317 [Astrocystis sublimbata]|nr:hypothetical protein F4808DRAFT_459317 [Astrocystis sublimbata]